MKSIKLVIVAALALASISAAAQTKENRDADGNILRGPYQTNKLTDNLFISAQGGINLFYDIRHDYIPSVAPAVAVDFGKWFSPIVGASLGYQGFAGKQNTTEVWDLPETTFENLNFFYVNGKILFNLSNIIGGYRSDRFWSFVPYVHGGYMRLYNVSDECEKYGIKYHDYIYKSPNEKDNELVIGPGLKNLIRVCPRLNITLTAQDMFYSSRYHYWQEGGLAHNFSILAGVELNLGKKTTFDRFRTDIVTANADLAKTNAALEDAKASINSLNRKLDQMKKDNEILAKNLKDCTDKEVVAQKDIVEVPLALGLAPLTLFYEINVDELNVTERAHLDNYVKNVIEKDPQRVFYLTGTADEGTGNEAINTRLSKARVEKVIKLLKEEYGISEDRLVLKAAKIVNEHKDPELDRSVRIEH